MASERIKTSGCQNPQVWQSIESAPLSEQEPIILFNGKHVVPGWRFECRWIDVWYDHMEPQPTHWMPLPEAPEPTP